MTVIFFWPQVGQGRALYWGDIGLYFTPMAQFLHDNLRAGRLPLWNPLILCGAPYVGNPQTWPLYPFSVLLPAVPAPYFLSLTIALHVWLAGLGTFFFLRRALGLGVGAALLGALTFMFSGWLVSKEQFPNMVQAAAYLPWVLWAVDRAAPSPGPSAPSPRLAEARHPLPRPLVPRWGEGRKKRDEGIATGSVPDRSVGPTDLTPSPARNERAGERVASLSEPGEGAGDALILGTVLGLQLLAAHAQMTLLTLYLAVAWRMFAWWRHRGRVTALAGRLGLAGLIAVGLSSGQLLPTLQLFHDGWRQTMSFRIVNRFYLPLNQSANWVLPTLHGHPSFGNFTARGNFWETCCYVGWLPFLAAIAGAVFAWRRGGDARLRFWSVTFLIGCGMAFGGGVSHRPGLYWLAYRFLPGFHSFHDPARCLIWPTFALAALAASGLDIALTRLTRPTPVAAAALLIAFADLAVFGRTIYPLADPATLFPVTRTVTALQGSSAFGAHQARFLAPDSERVWERFTGRRAYRQGIPQYEQLWTDTLTPNLMMPYGLPDAYGYEPVTRHDTQQVVGAINGAFRPNAPRPERARAAAWAGALGVRSVVTDRVRPPEASLPGLTPLFSDPSLPPLYAHTALNRVCLSRNTRWQPRARLVTDFAPADSGAAGLRQVLDALAHPGRGPLDLGRTVVVAGTVSFGPCVAPSSPATITEDSPDEVIVVAAPKRPSLLVLADTLHPGWRATVDGRPAPLLSADGCLRAVALPSPGPHRVVFSYRPVTFLLGLYLTLLTLAALIGAALFHVANKIGEESRTQTPKIQA